MDVELPDGTVVQGIPDGTTRAQLAVKLRANGHQVPDSWLPPAKADAGPDPKEQVANALGKETRFEMGNLNKGIAAGLGAPVDLAQDVVNLGKAAFGTAATAMGRKDLAPDTRDDAVGGSKWIEALMRQHNMISGDADPKTLREKAGAALLQGGGNIIGGAAGTTAALRTAAKVENLVKRPPLSGIVQGEEPMVNTVRELRKEGYVFPPSQVNPSIANRTLEGVAGKVKTAQEFSIKNQETTNSLGKKALGVSQNTPLTADTIQAVREPAYATYDKVRSVEGSFPLDANYQRSVKSLNNEFAGLEQKFPGLTKSPEVEELKSMLLSPAAVEQGLSPGEAIDLTRLLRKKATANFKVATNAVGGDPEKLAIAQAQRDAAGVVEDLISRNLKDKGKKALYEDWVDARKQLAISHDIESVLNPDTGNIDEKAVAALARKGRPLQGPMQTIARFARSFPKAAQSPEKIGGVPESVMDALLATAGAGIGGHYGGGEGAMAGATGGAAARSMLRQMLMSDAYQNRMVKP